MLVSQFLQYVIYSVVRLCLCIFENKLFIFIFYLWINKKDIKKKQALVLLVWQAPSFCWLWRMKSCTLWEKGSAEAVRRTSVQVCPAIEGCWPLPTASHKYPHTRGLLKLSCAVGSYLPILYCHIRSGLFSPGTVSVLWGTSYNTSSQYNSFEVNVSHSSHTRSHR